MATCFTISLMFLLMTADVDGQQDWEVKYNPSYVCALRGSTVRMSCIYPPGYWITSSYWTKTTHQPYSVSPNLCSDTYYIEKVQCHTNSITLTHVTDVDKHVYYCIFTASGYSREWRGTPGVQLDVTGVQGSALYTVSGIVAGCGGLFFIIIFIILFIKKRRTDSRAEHMNQKQTADSSDDTYTALNPASRTSADIYNTIRVNLSNIHSQTLLHSNSHENKIYSSCFFHSRISAGLLMASTRLLSFSPDLLNMRHLQ
ncbi:hypothetical protein E1301_Tti017122 [Triplophysa tibetana]|uniref:Ig-like domain-containing protein n=1 Tax=Triplophysa tibetana TaxID=1572043 RepID=A0A5A9PJ59_9TELE|nr:hypothetical protein E1301_Tti017122 [Triplophysa tibetana]